MPEQQSRVPTDGAYISWARHGSHGLAQDYAADWLADVLASGQTLHRWAAGHSGSALMHGRGAVYSVDSPFPGRNSALVVRHYRRGGRMAALLGDRYMRMGQPRPEREAMVSAEARRRGVRTPAVVAAAWYTAGVFYRADLATELVPGSRSLAELLFSDDRSSDREEALALSGRLIKDLSAAGILHADLNAMNILLNREAGELSAHVIDLDRARLVETGGGRSMLLRLERSLRKRGSAASRHLAEDEWRTLRNAAGVES